MLLILYSIFGVNLRNGGKMVRKKMVEKWILNGFYFDKGNFWYRCLIKVVFLVGFFSRMLSRLE